MLTVLHLATLTLLALPVADSCPSCSVRAQEVRLCEAHEKSQSDALAEHGEAVLAEDPEMARAAIIALETSRDGHRNAPTVELSRAIARGLEHPSFAVRTTVLLAFDKTLDAEVTEEVLDACVRAYRGQSRDLARRQAEAMRALDERPKAPIERLTLLSNFDALDPSAPSLVQETTQFQGYSDGLFQLLTKRGDEGLDRMLDLAPAVRDGAVVPHRLVLGIVQRGRRDGVRAGLGFLKDWQEQREELSRELARREKLGLPKAPDDFAGNEEQWRAEAGRQREARLRFLRECVQAHAQVGNMLQAAFGAMAIVSTRIEDAPPIGETPYTEWRAWFRKHSRQLPERLAPEPSRR